MTSPPQARPGSRRGPHPVARPCRRAEPDIRLRDGHEGFERPLYGELPAQAALLGAAVGLPHHLPAALIDLDPPGVDTVGCAQDSDACRSEAMRGRPSRGCGHDRNVCLGDCRYGLPQRCPCLHYTGPEPLPDIYAPQTIRGSGGIPMLRSPGPVAAPPTAPCGASPGARAARRIHDDHHRIPSPGKTKQIPGRTPRAGCRWTRRRESTRMRRSPFTHPVTRL